MNNCPFYDEFDEALHERPLFCLVEDVLDSDSNVYSCTTGCEITKGCCKTTVPQFYGML